MSPEEFGLYNYRGLVRHVNDGDTVVIDVDLGFRAVQTMTFRLNGINTPEVVGENRSLGLAAKELVESLILNKYVRIKTFKDKKEKYGRYLADVYYSLDSVEYNLKDILLQKGLAVEYDGRGPKT